MRTGAVMTLSLSMPARLGLICSIALSLMVVVASRSLAQTCTPDQIAAVIDGTGAELRKLSAVHQPALQSKLRRLAERNGWQGADIESRGAELLNDSETASLDDQANQLLSDLDRLGDETTSDDAACAARLAQLKTIASQLLEVTAAKASHVSAKLDTALRESDGAKPSKPEPKVAAKTAPVVAEAKPTPPAEMKPAAATPPTESKPATRQASNEPPPRPVAPESPSAKAPRVGAWETDTQHGRPAVVAPGQDVVADLTQPIPKSADQEFTAD